MNRNVIIGIIVLAIIILAVIFFMPGTAETPPATETTPPGDDGARAHRTGTGTDDTCALSIKPADRTPRSETGRAIGSLLDLLDRLHQLRPEMQVARRLALGGNVGPDALDLSHA